MHDLYKLSIEDKRMKRVNDKLSPFKMFSASIELGQESKKVHSVKMIPEYPLIDYEMKGRNKVNLWHNAIVKNKWDN